MYKVWIVDDEPLVSDGLSRQVHWESFNMELAGTATNGHDVLTALEREPAQLLITDVSMPRMDGLTLIARAKQICPSIRCIIISAYSEFEYVKRGLQLGVENYLVKPINESELQETLSKTLQNLIRDQLAVTQDSPDVLAFRTNILDRWVNGGIQEFELYERAELLNIDLSAPEYAVCIIDIIHPDEKSARFKQASALLDLCRSTLLPAFNGECFLDGSFRVTAILYDSSPGQLQPRLIDSLRVIRKEASSSGMHVFSSLGPASATSASVSASYLCAAPYLDYRFLDPSAESAACPRYTDIQFGSVEESQLLLQFGKSLKEGNVSLAHRYTDKIIQLHGKNTFPELKSNIVPLALTLVRTLIESGRIADALPSNIVTHLAGFAALKSPDELKTWWEQSIAGSEQVIHERKGSYHLLIHRTLEQVNRHYASELSLKTLASSYNVSPAYLGQLFKEETGKYFNDYLTDVRLLVSRQLLIETDLKIIEIAQKIGIPNQSYFNRVFKKMYDVSPLEFRRQGLKA